METQFSIILPTHNEEENVLPLVEELSGVLDRLGEPYEIILVDDASTDGTVDRVRETARSFPAVRLVRHRVNAGQSAAYMSGFIKARGKILITMDSDLQHDPEDIPRLLETLKECDLVCGIRANRRDTWVKKVSSRIANGFRNLCLQDGIHDSGCTFRAMRRHMVDQLVPFKGLHRFLPTICRIHGYKVKEININHRPRRRGISKYGIGNRLFVGIHDLLGMRWYRKRHFIPDRIAEDDSVSTEPAGRPDRKRET